MKKNGFYRWNLPHFRFLRVLSERITRPDFYLRKPLSVSLVLFCTGAVLYFKGGVLLPVMQKAAIFSAALAMPEAGISQLQEQYQDILYPPSVPQNQDFPPDWENTPVSDAERFSDLNEPELVQSQASPASEPLPAPNPPDTSPYTEPEVSFSSSPVYKVASPAASSRYIAPENRGVILSQTFSSMDSPIYIQFGQGKIKNSTNLTNSQAEEILNTPCTIDIADLSEPTVLIYHTHATEAYEPFDADYFDKTYNWRSDDNDKNMVAVGTALSQKLEQAGVGVVHIKEQHDNPSYNGAYDKSAQTIRDALEQYPSIRVILDIHRDAIQRDTDTIVKAVADIDGRKAAQLMIIAGCDDNGSLGMPQWKQNFRFSAALQDILETMYPGLCRPVFFCYRKYNMDLCPNGALIEIGSHGNTLEEAQYTAELLGNALVVMLQGQE